MKIIRAEHLGMCFGVKDAIGLAFKTAESQPLTVLGELVHNETVLAALRARGIAIQSDLTRIQTATAMVTAHGASQQTLDRAESLGLRLVEATCPLVRVAHRAVARLVRDGYHPVIIGQRGHVEVRGLTDDLEEFDVVLSEPEIAALRPRAKFGVAAQTTQPIERVSGLVRRLERQFPESEVRFVDTVCQPTKQRQTAAVELAKQCDVVVVVGGRNSNNTRELVATCARFCPRVFHVQGPEEIETAWFAEGELVGLTAGTSTPDETIDAVERQLARAAHSAEEPFHSSTVCFGSSEALVTSAGERSSCLP